MQIFLIFKLLFIFISQIANEQENFNPRPSVSQPPISTVDVPLNSHNQPPAHTENKPLFQYYIDRDPPNEPTQQRSTMSHPSIHPQQNFHVENPRKNMRTGDPNQPLVNTPHRNPPQSGSYSIHRPDEEGGVSDRPFTRRIDKIIAKEKEGGARHDPVLPHFGIGPLDPPDLSSTQRSDYNQRELVQFQPLEAESRTSLSSNSDIYQSNRARCKESDGNNNTNRVVFHSPVETASYPPYDDQQFMDYYQTLGPDERRQELLAQKSALLQEQRRLKTILLDQEEMLRSKQDQLHKQQEVQRERLKFFEQTGTFPPHHTYSDAAAAAATRDVRRSEPSQPLVDNNQFMLNVLHMQPRDTAQHPDVPRLNAPTQYGGQPAGHMPVNGREHDVPVPTGLPYPHTAPGPEDMYTTHVPGNSRNAIGPWYQNSAPEPAYRHSAPEPAYRHSAPEPAYKHSAPEPGYEHASPVYPYTAPGVPNQPSVTQANEHFLERQAAEAQATLRKGPGTVNMPSRHS